MSNEATVEYYRLLNERLNERLGCWDNGEIARAKSEEALVRSEQLASVGRMAAVISHEINNPLAAVTDLLYLARSVEETPDPVIEYLNTADDELKRIAQITRQTLGLYREAIFPTIFTVGSLLDAVLDLLKAKIKAKHAVVLRQYG
ncbi:MAG: hypothetical protein M3Y50_15825 [Acidobacteriota bacterium]|nr:hypothetical protein [Acidobacteriota bacterium]